MLYFTGGRMSRNGVLGLISKDEELNGTAIRFYITLYVGGSMTASDICKELNLKK